MSKFAAPDTAATAACPICARHLTQPARGRRRRYCSRACQARAYRARRDRPVHAPRTPRPARLTTVAITRAAVDLADRDGLDGLSMRRLAGALGVATAAIYRRFADREALLAAMTELVIAETPPPAPARDIRAGLLAEARQEWLLYQRHPWVLPVLARTSPPIGPALLDVIERWFVALEELELPGPAILPTYLAFSGLVQGLALVHTSERTVVGADRSTGEDLDDLLVGRPATARILAATEREPDFGELLTTGMGLLLDGVALRYRERTE